MEIVSSNIISHFSHYTVICMDKLSINVLSFRDTIDCFISTLVIEHTDQNIMLLLHYHRD